jgi:hypothetical protein
MPIRQSAVIVRVLVLDASETTWRNMNGLSTNPGQQFAPKRYDRPGETF